MKKRSFHLSAHQNRRGSALVTGMALLSTLAILALALLTSAVDSSRSTERHESEFTASAGAENALALAVNHIWSGFMRERNGAPTSHWDFRNYMDELGVPHDDGTTEPVDVLAMAEFPRREDGAVVIDGVTVENLEVTREDGFRDSRLLFTATVATNQAGDGTGARASRHTVEQSFQVTAADWEGLNYALLANNINCIMCHTEVDNVERFYNTDPTLYNSFPRVRIGSLESFQLREDPHSSVAGSLYLMGKGVTEDGHELTDWDDISFKSREFDGNGYLSQDDWGDLTATDLRPADPNNPAAFENLYVGYTQDEAAQVDGYLPTSFPPPFPDDGGIDPATGDRVEANADNRMVDSTEFWGRVADSKGTVSGGAINVFAGAGSLGDGGFGGGGLLALLPALASQETTPETVADLTEDTTDKLDPITKGSVFLQGTEDDPILLNGEVAIDGDVIISGVVKGKGTLLVSGNVYIPTDLTYADGSSYDGTGRTFGMSADGQENALAISSAGNIMVGDFFRPAFNVGDVTTGEKDGSFNFIMDELSLFNRMEWLKTQEEVPGPPVTWVVKEQKRVVTGTKTKNTYKWQKTGDKIEKAIWEKVPVNPEIPPEYGGATKWVITGYKTVDEWEKVKTGTKEVKTYKWVEMDDPREAVKTREIKKTENLPIPNPAYEGEDYIARYYSFDEDGTIPIFNKDGYYDPDTDIWVSKEHVGKWDDKKLSYLDPTDHDEELLYKSNGSARAVISTLTPSGDWISNKLLRELILEELDKRGKEEDLVIDATLYSNNSIFGIIPHSDGGETNGRMIINGGLVAADIGLLAPEGVKLNYDSRGKGLIDIQSDSQLVIRRELFARVATPQY